MASTLAAGAGSVATQGPFCDVQVQEAPRGVRVFDRTLDVWYGMLRIGQANGDLVSTTDSLDLDKLINANRCSRVAMRPWKAGDNTFTSYVFTWTA